MDGYRLMHDELVTLTAPCWRGSTQRGINWQHAQTATAISVGSICHSRVEPSTSASSNVTLLRAWDDLDAYNDDLVAQRRQALTDDLISDLIRAEVDGDRLSHDELLMLAGGLLMAGTDTTRNQLATAVQVLCDHPDQWALLAAHPELAAKAVEELMRHSLIIFSTMRVTLEDVDLAGVAIPAGTLVTANIAAANRDPAVDDEPDRFDLTQRGAAGHADLRWRHPLSARTSRESKWPRRLPSSRAGCAIHAAPAPPHGGR